MLRTSTQFQLAHQGLTAHGQFTTLKHIYSPLFDTLLVLQQVHSSSEPPYRVAVAPRKLGQFQLVASAASHEGALQIFNRAIQDFEGRSRQSLTLAGDRRSRDKVYKWEDLTLKSFDHKISESSFRNIVHKLSRILRVRLPDIDMATHQAHSSSLNARIAASYNFHANRMKVPDPMRTPITAIHEMTHGLLDHAQKGQVHLFHGPAFVRVATALYHREVGAPLTKMIDAAKELDIWGPDAIDRTSRIAESLTEICQEPDRFFMKELQRHRSYQDISFPR